MSNTTTVQARIKTDVKNNVLKVLEANGLTMTQFIKFVFNKVARDERLDFDMFAPNQRTIDAMNEDNSMSKVFNTVEELMEDLNAED